MKTKLAPFFLFAILSAFVIGIMQSSPVLRGIPVSAQERSHLDMRLDTPLMVIGFGPEGEIAHRSQARSIHVTFSEKMVPMTFAGETTVGMMIIDPPLNGRLRWTGTSSLVYTSDDSLPFNTACTVMIPAGLKSLNGATLRESFVFRFETPRLRVEQLHAGEDQDDIAPREMLQLHFTQPVPLDEAMRCVTVTDTIGRKLAIRLRHPRKRELAAFGRTSGLVAADRRVLILIEPHHAWPLGAEMTIAVAQGMQGIEGKFGMRERFIQTVRASGDLVSRGLVHGSSDHPYSEIRFQFSSRVRVKELLKELIFYPDVVIPKECGDLNYAARDIRLPIAFQPGMHYIYRIRDGLKSIHGRPIAREQWGLFTTADLPPGISMISGHVIMAPDRYRIPTLTVTNVDRVQLKMAAVSPEEVLGMKPFAWDVVRNWEINPGKNRVTKLRLPFSELKPSGRFRFYIAEVTDTARNDSRRLNLLVSNLGVTGKFSPESTRILVTRLDNAAPVDDADIEIYAETGALLHRGRTDAEGLMTASGWNRWNLRSPDDWSTPKINVIVRKRDDVAVLASDWVDGIESWRFPIPHINAGVGKELRGVVFTDRGIYRPGDSVLVKGIVRSSRAEGLTPLDTDTVHLLVLGPTGDDIFSASLKVNRFGGFDCRMQLPVGAPLGNYSLNVRLDDPGSDESRWSQEPVVYSSSFRVAEYRPTRMKADVTITSPQARLSQASLSQASLTQASPTTLREMKGSHGNGGATIVKVAGSSLAGTPLAGRKARVTAHLGSRNPRFEKYSNFSFNPEGEYYYGDGDYCGGYDGEYENDGSYHPGSNSAGMTMLFDREVILGRDGTWQESVKIALPRQRTSTAGAPGCWSDGELHVEATITEMSGQTISARSSEVIPRCEFVSGIRVDGGFVATGEKARIEAIVLSRKGEPVSGREMKLSLVRRTWVNRMRQSDGGPVWESKMKDEVVATTRVTSCEKPATWEVTPPTAGCYVVYATIRDDAGSAMRSGAMFYVWGDEGGWWRSNDDRLELLPEKSSYKPGETARIVIRSPFKSARAWITLEREGVSSSRVVSLSGSTPMIEVPITDAHLPNIYLAVLLINTETGPRRAAHDGDGQGYGNASAVRLGLVNIPVEPSGKRITVDARSAAREYEPGESATVRVKLTDPSGKPVTGECAIAVVDEGVLSLIAYRFPDPMGTFFAQHAHHVATAELRTRLVDGMIFGEKGEDPSADGSNGSMSSPAWLRKDFRPTAAWFPSVTTDENGEAIVTFALPHTITTYRILVMAQDGRDRFGATGVSTFFARRPLVLEPALPRFVRAGDEVRGGVLVRNLSGRDGMVVVTCTAAGVSGAGEARSLFLKSDEDSIVHWRFRVGKNASNVKFRFNGRMTNFALATDACEVTLPVATRAADVIGAASGSVVASEAKEWISLPRDIRSDAGGLSVSVSSTALVQLRSAMEYLFTYPYGCLEQRTSCIMPMIVFGDVAKELGLRGLAGGPSDVDAAVKTWLLELSQYQTPSGGFGLWKGDQNPYPYLSALVVKMMIRARHRGYVLPADSLSKALRYLDEIVKKGRHEDAPYGERAWYAVDATIIEALAEAGVLRAGDLEIAFRHREKMPVQGLASLYRAARIVKADEMIAIDLRRRILNALRISPTTAHFSEPGPSELEWLFHTDVTTTAAALEALLIDEHPFAQAEQVARWIATQRVGGRWRSTRENAVVLGALGAYYRRFESATPMCEVEAAVAGTRIVRGEFQGRSLDVKEGVTTMGVLIEKGVEKNLPVTVRSTGAGRVYYEMRLKSSRVGDDAARDAGFSIERRIETLDGDPIDPRKVKAGGVYRMKVVVTTTAGKLFVAVDAPLPAGLEAVDLSLATERNALAQQAGIDHNGGWWSGFRRKELRDDRALWFADELGAGRYELNALVRATSSGRFAWPAARAEEMYAPEVFGRTSEERVVVSGPGKMPVGGRKAR